MPAFHHLRLAHGQIVASALLCGLIHVTRTLLVRDIHPVVLTALVFGIATLFLTTLVRPSWTKMTTFLRRYPWQVPLLSSVSMGGTLSFTIALGHLGASVATVLERLVPLAVLMLSALFLKERLSRRAIPWIVLALMASWSMSVPSWEKGGAAFDSIGILAIVGAVFSWGATITLGRFLLKTSDLPINEFTILRYGVTVVLLMPLLIFVPPENLTFTLSPLKWVLLIGVATFVLGAATNLYYRGLRHVDAPTASFLEMPTPLVAVLIGHFFLGEPFGPVRVISMVLLLLAVYQIVRVGTAPKSPPIPTEEV